MYQAVQPLNLPLRDKPPRYQKTERKSECLLFLTMGGPVNVAHFPFFVSDYANVVSEATCHVKPGSWSEGIIYDNVIVLENFIFLGFLECP